MTETPLDTAHAQMEAADGDIPARLKFFERLLESELFLLLEAEPSSDKVTPMSFPLQDHTYVLVFDREDRLTQFTEKTSAFVAMSGRKIIAMLDGLDLGLGVNLTVAPSSMMIPPSAVDWLRTTLIEAPVEIRERPKKVTAPTGLSPALVRAFEEKLASATGLASHAFLVGMTYGSGRSEDLLVVIDAVPGAEAALTTAMAEAISFSGVDMAKIELAFFDHDDPLIAHFQKLGLRFDIPAPATPVGPAPTTPGMDPNKPPIL